VFLEFESFDIKSKSNIDLEEKSVKTTDLNNNEKYYLDKNLLKSTNDHVFENDEYNFICLKANQLELTQNDKSNKNNTTLEEAIVPAELSKTESKADSVKENKNSLESTQNINKKAHIFLGEADNKIPKPDQIQQDEYLYLYVDFNKYYQIFNSRSVELDTIIYGGELINAILLLNLPPDAEDKDLLNELYGENVEVNKNRVQCYVQFRKKILEQFKEEFFRIDNHKYLCKKRIQFGKSFPKHEFRYKFNK